MSPDVVKWIAVHFCEVCGEHAHEEQGVGTSYYIEGIALGTCDTCGLLMCVSCYNDGFCCDRRAEIEMEGRPKARQMGLFETTLEEPPMAY